MTPHALRRHDGFTLPELIGVVFLLGIATAALFVYPRFAQERSADLAAAASIDSTARQISALWTQNGDVCPAPDSSAGCSGPLVTTMPNIAVVNGDRTLSASNAVDTVSVAYIPGYSGVVGIAAMGTNGNCLLTRIEWGDGAGSQRYGIAPDGAASGCSGVTALTLDQQNDTDRDGGSWSSPVRLS